MAWNSRSRKALKRELQNAQHSSKHVLDEEVEVVEHGFGEVLSPEQSIQELKDQTQIRRNFSEWLSVIHSKHPVARLTGTQEDGGKVLQFSSNPSSANVGVQSNINVNQNDGDKIVNQNVGVSNEFTTPVQLSFRDAVKPQSIEVGSGSKSKVNPTNYVRITNEDISPEVAYWNTLIVCYVLGANPPIQVFEGFINRVWRKFEVDKVASIQKGVFIVHFTTMENRDKVLNSERPFFDHKPLIMKAWSENVDYAKDEVKVVPVWVQLELDFKYWGLGVLEKIVRPLGTLIQVDAATSNRDKLSFCKGSSGNEY
ncbi:adenylate kinase [Bienertia sinuspersici]